LFFLLIKKIKDEREKLCREAATQGVPICFLLLLKKNEEREKLRREAAAHGVQCYFVFNHSGGELYGYYQRVGTGGRSRGPICLGLLGGATNAN
jgi:hypothetical protein